VSRGASANRVSEGFMIARNLRRFGACLVLYVLFVFDGSPVLAQGLGGAGMLQGTIKDPTGGVMQAVEVRISNPVSGYSRATVTDQTGRYVFTNLSPNSYHVAVDVQGFQRLDRDVDVRTGVPITLDLTLALAAATASVSVVGHVDDLLERDPSAHLDIDTKLIEKLPIETSSGLNQVITLASPGVVSDSNGFFHPIGDHAQTQFSIDNQPVTDQQSRVYSNQISPEAVQSMEIITGVAPAEYGDKSSLVVHIVTKSGLDQPKPTGNVSLGYGSFSSPSGALNVGVGSHAIGNFMSISGLKTARYLDPPEFEAIHDSGNAFSLFDRIDAHTGETATLHLNVQAGRSSFDVPNTYDQEAAGQAQHQAINTFNVAPGFSQVFGDNMLFTVNGFVRRDRLTYSPSPNPFADLPATVSQDRTLTNYGAKADVTYTTANHNIKTGGSISATGLHEQFTFGITDPTSPDFADENGNFNEDLRPYDLTQPGGSPLLYDQRATIKQQAAYIQDDIKAGSATLKLGVRFDHYDGLVSASAVEPRLGVSYAVPGVGTVVRASYGRTMETPYNENLLLSSGVGLNGLFGSGEPLGPGRRNQGEFGVQQAFGRWIVADFGYFTKETDNGYDFNVLFGTPIVFPIAWNHSTIDGFTGRVTLVERRGFSAFVVMGHTSAIFSPPGVGGILLEQPDGDFRIDHDQKFNSTTNIQYVFDKRTGAWAALSWRYDSGLIAGSVATVEDALALTGDQQAAIGFYCGSVVASRQNPITSCASGAGATRVVIPTGQQDDVNNPPRIAPRHLFDVGIGVDNLFRTDKAKVRLRLSVLNLTNKDALYNFLSTFTGTHFVTPRAFQFQAGVAF
jgi:hypothetical protein